MCHLKTSFYAVKSQEQSSSPVKSHQELPLDAVQPWFSAVGRSRSRSGPCWRFWAPLSWHRGHRVCEVADRHPERCGTQVGAEPWKVALVEGGINGMILMGNGWKWNQMEYEI